MPLQDPKRAADEVRHASRRFGLKAGFARPNAYNDRPLHHPVYTPVWEALSETGLPIAFHPAGLADMPGASRALGGLMAPGTHHALILLIDQQMTLSNLTYGGVLERFPELKVIVLECGGGWIAHWMDRLDEFLESYGWATPPLSLTPREYFHRQCWISFDPGERTAPLLWPLIGADRITWASDFPHSRRQVSRRGRRVARKYTADMDADAPRRIVRAQRSRDVFVVSTDLDLLIVGGTVVDGTGAPPRTADVAVVNGRVAEVGRVDATGARERIDADGLLITPGFVDIHTHYDAQLHWDPTASPAPWHGVTTLMTGNCGFTLAPSRPEDVEWLMLMLSRVEGMSADALRAGVPFRGGTLADFLAGLDGAPGCQRGCRTSGTAPCAAT